MKRIVKRILVITLACVIVFTSSYKPIKAEAAEAGIIGGALAGAGVALTVPQIALLVAAAGGCVYLYTHREEVAETLVTVLDKAAENVENGREQLQAWWDRAVLGYIAIDTAADFIKDGVKDWVGDLHAGENLPTISGEPYDQYGDRIYGNGETISKGGIFRYGLGEYDYLYTRYGYDFISYLVYSAAYDYKETETSLEVTLHYWAMVPTTASYEVFVQGDGTEYVATNKATIGNQQYIYHNGSLGINVYTTEDIANVKRLLQRAYPSQRLTSSSMLTEIKNGQADTIVSGEQSICPDNLTGGISNALDTGYNIDDVNIPDLLVDGTGSICPDTTLTGEDVFAGSVSDVMSGLATGTMSWSDYISDVGTSVPSVTVPDAETETGTKDFVITDTGVSDTVIDNTATSAPELDDYKVQLRDFFPFCLPFDMVEFISVLAAEPETPVFDLKFPSINGEVIEFQVDLSDWDPVAQLMRNLELLALIIGLCFKTRSMIRG